MSALYERTVHAPGGTPGRPYRMINIPVAGGERRPGTVLLVVASGLLFLLAAGLGYVSWRAQFMFVNKAKNAPLAAGLEALGLDAAAVIFALLGLAHARMGRPARVERVLNVACALGSMVMNVLAADLGSPRSVAVYVLPPVLYAACSDRLIAVAGSAAGVRETSLWRVAGAAAPYLLRLVLAPPSTARGLRRWVLAATPLPGGTPSSPRAGLTGPREGTAALAVVAGPAARAPASSGGRGSRRPARVDQRVDGPAGQPAGRGEAARAFAAELAAGKVPGIRRIREQLGCGQARAVQVQKQLRAEVTS